MYMYIYIYVYIYKYLSIYLSIYIYTGLQISAGHQTMSNMKTKTSTDAKVSYA